MLTKKLLHILIFICGSTFVIFSFSSCQKEVTGNIISSDSTLTPINATTKVKTYAEYVVSASTPLTLADSFDLIYDSKDRVTTLNSLINSGKFIYTYNTNNTYTMDIFAGNTLSIHMLFLLNNNALVDSTIQSNSTGDTTTEKYIYNLNKQLVAKKEIFQSMLSPTAINYSYTYDNNGNVINETTDNPSSTTTYAYYTDKPNDINVGETYFYRNKNLTKTTTISSGGTIISAQHTYTFDSNNRQTSEKVITSNGDTVIKKYTYY